MKQKAENKVLVIPSWYPTRQKPIEGSFFQEQAIAMSHLYDTKILYHSQKIQNRLVRFLNTIKFLLKVKPKIKFLEDTYTKEPTMLLFETESTLGIFGINRKALIRDYLVAFERITSLGWYPDVIHAHCVFFGGIIGSSIGLRFNVPYIITEHNVFQFYSFHPSLQKLIKSAFESAQSVISVSKHQSRMILMPGINCQPINVGNLINQDVFFIKPRANRIFTILFVSYDSYIKDNDTFFKAISLFRSKSTFPFVVKILGRTLNNDNSNYFYLLAQKYNVTDCVEITNLVSRNEIVSFFQLADVFVSTSIAETFGVSMCEALFCGVPIISTANGGVDEMIDEKNGILVDLKDHGAISAALIKIANKEFIYNRDEVRATAVDKFGKEAFIQKMNIAYTSAILNYNLKRLDH
jgi:glycosyltransferase involved in cell wall biosynthesis